jgi:hypothetical protein
MVAPSEFITVAFAGASISMCAKYHVTTRVKDFIRDHEVACGAKLVEKMEEELSLVDMVG